METTQLSTEIEFDLFKTLKVIESNIVLDDLFRKDKNISYNSLYSKASKDILDLDLLEKAKEIFDRVISKNQKPLEQYLKLTSNEINKSKRKLPKHYGKKRIMEDIQSNNTTSELDRAMLALNTLRNISSKLRARGIKDKLMGTNILTDLDCRDIVAAVRVIENKVSNILKKK